MASGKYERKAPAKTIKTYHKFESRPQGKYEQKTSSPKYKMSPIVKRKIMALIAAGFIAKSVIIPTPPQSTARAAEEMPTAHAVSTLEYSSEQTVYTLGVANYDTELTVNDENYPIGNSFVIVSENQVFTSDVHENFLKGQLSDSDFKEFI